MQYLNSRLLFITILCLYILIDDTNSLRVRIPSLRLSATFGRTASFIKRKLHMDDNEVISPDEPSTLKVRSPEKNDDF